MQVHCSVTARKEKELMPIQLEECMKTFTASETVTAYCGDCTKANNGEYTETEQEKKLAPWALPPVLVITLKRFKTTAHSRQKLTSLVVTTRCSKCPMIRTRLMLTYSATVQVLSVSVVPGISSERS